MRALNPRRPQQTSIFHLFPRSFLCLLLLLFLLHDARARSVSREEDAVQPVAKLSTVENTGDVDGAISGSDASEKVQGKLAQLGDHGLEKERGVPGELGNAEEKISQTSGEGRNRDEGSPLVSDQELKKIETGTGEVPKQEDEEASVAKKRRRNDATLAGKSDLSEGENEGIRRFDAKVDADGSAASEASQVPLEKQESEESRVAEVDESKEKTPNYFRKSGKIEEDESKSEEEIASNSNSESLESEEYRINRDYRSLEEVADKVKRKSSTVYLSAEEKKVPDGEQQSIVDGQIKKLISIRDDALDAQKTDPIDEVQLSSTKKEAGLDEVAITQEEVQGQRKSKVKPIESTNSKRSIGDGSLLGAWKDQAVSLQAQIRDKTFLSRLKEQASVVLPEIPKFSEVQLLDALERTVRAKGLQPLNDSYDVGIKELGLSELQLRIIRCAQQLIAVRERQSFVENLSECVRGLSILNCMRIFVGPVLFDNFPIEINVFDLFQGSRQKSGRAQVLHQIRLLPPDFAVYNILQEALESYPSDETLVSYVDPQNETLQNLLSDDRMNILQMAEKFLPQTLRRDYSDKIFSCVRRFEYFSCVKYFAWPLIKQYFPALPAFPDYQTWYPIIDLSPQYPIFSYPSFSEDVGELPEVVDADATRTKKPKPEAIIIQVLQNTLKEQSRTSASPSYLDHSKDAYITLLPEDQLLTINMAEQLIPTSHRLEFVEKTARCMKEYNYLTCFKYSTWPIIRHYIPTLPDISSLLPDFLAPEASDIDSYLSEIPTYYWPVYGTDIQEAAIPTEYALKNRANAAQSIDETEAELLEILQRVRSTSDSITELSPYGPTANTLNFPTLTSRQLKILQLAEILLPDSARAALTAEMIVCLDKTNSFIDSVRYVAWPTIAKYVPSLPEFPVQDAAKDSLDRGNIQSLLRTKESTINSAEAVQERISPDVDKENAAGGLLRNKESRGKLPNVPLINVSGIRFVPIFTDYPEAVILNILQSLQLQSFKTNAGTPSFATKNQQFIDFLNEQQKNIVNMVDSLLPESIRPEFANKMIACLRVNTFLICTRDVVWPMLSNYFPWLPSFPNFSFLTTSPPVDSSSPPSTQTLTEPSSSSDSPPLSETNVKTGLHGDTTVTTTDTRFFPILNEMPESIILNILKAVELSAPILPGSPVPARTQDFSPYLTEQQINVLRVVENLLPVATRTEFINKISPCIAERSFLECTRDIAWPTIAQIYPWLPSFPNFGSLRNLPQIPGHGSIRFQVFLAEKPPLSNFVGETSRNNLNKETKEDIASMGIEMKIEKVLLRVLSKTLELDESYLNTEDPLIPPLTKQQISIIRLIERGLPETARPSCVAKMLQCVTRYDFVSCTRSVGWPVLKEYVPHLPDFSIAVDELALPAAGPKHLEAGKVAVLPDILANSIPRFAQLPETSQLPTELPQLPLNFGGSPGQKYQNSGTDSRVDTQENKATGSPSLPPSVGNEGIVPAYAGQPPGILVNLQGEQVQLPPIAATKPDPAIKVRKRRSTMDILEPDNESEQASHNSPFSPPPNPNITETEYLQLLIRLKEVARFSSAQTSKSKQYFVDTLNSTIRNSLTADQYEILKIVEDLDSQPSSKGLVSQVVQCITSLSFIRCLGIFIWPLITNNLPSIIGLPSFPSFGIFGRSIDTESQVQEFFGMSTGDFEKQLVERKESIEDVLLDWYRKLVEDEFQLDMGFAKIKGYGNNEVGISFSGFREGRGAKLKDNKNLPSILTIISDIMEEVLDQRPEGEKTKREKEKKERSIDDSRETDIQFLKDSEEYVDIKRSINDDEIITMFLNKIKTNDSELDNDDETYFSSEDAYDAFGVLFGTKLHEVDTLEELKSLEEGSNDRNKEVDIVSLESQKAIDALKTLPLKSQVTYDFDKESSRDQEEKQRQKRANNFVESLFEKHASKYPRDSGMESFETVEDNKIVDDRREKIWRSSVVVKLPRLHDEVVPKKVTNSMTHLGRAFNSKMSEMMPGFGLILSFLLQMGLAHARAAASMAGMISNIALGSAMFGMLRDSMFGSNNHPQIKYVYDNHKTGPGISWPTQHQSASHYYG